jgi:hypothetical protein
MDVQLRDFWIQPCVQYLDHVREEVVEPSDLCASAHIDVGPTHMLASLLHSHDEARTEAEPAEARGSRGRAHHRLTRGQEGYWRLEAWP